MKSSARVVVVYMVVAATWILVTDSLVLVLGIDEGSFQLAKGMLFVLVTSGVLLAVLGREERLREASRAEADRSREVLAEREHEYRALFEANPQPMWVLDTQEQAFLAVNQAAIDKYGYSRDEFMAMPGDVLLVPTTVGADSDSDLNGLAMHATKDGRRLYVELTSNSVHFDGHAAALVLADDMTGRLLAERALRDAKRHVEAIIDTSPLAIVLLDTDATVTRWNPAAERIFGWKAEEVVGMPNPIVPDESVKEFKEMFSGVLDGQSAAGRRLLRKSKSGELVSVVLYSAAITDDDGHPEAAIGMFADVTEQVRAEQELRQYRERLEELVQARTAELSIVNERLSDATRVKSEFLANMSHELRTPLNSIIGFSGAMLQGLAGDLGEEQRKQLGMVYRSGKHLLELINDVLDLSKIEAGRFTVETHEFDVYDIVTSVIESLDMQIAASGLEIRAIEPESHMKATTDRTKVRQILINLIGNAVKFTESGMVEVAVEREGEMLVICVADTGPGIPTDEHALIFDEFTQSKRRADEKPQGTGLGLAISRRLARILGGDIELSSEVGRGSTFCLRIPIAYSPVGDDGSGDTGHQRAQVK